MKISKISRSTAKPSRSDIFHLLNNLLKYLQRTCFLRRSFLKFLPLVFLSFGPFRITSKDSFEAGSPFRLGKLVFLQLNGAIILPQKVDFRPFRTAFSADWRSGEEAVHILRFFGHLVDRTIMPKTLVLVLKDSKHTSQNQTCQ